MLKIEIIEQSHALDHSFWAGAEPDTYAFGICMRDYCNTGHFSFWRPTMIPNGMGVPPSFQHLRQQAAAH